MNTIRQNKSSESLKKALVLFSGGQDSTTCLAWALNHYDKVETIGFSYGQRHAVELTVRPGILQKIRNFSENWNKKLGEDHVFDLSLIGNLSETAMTSDVEIKMMENWIAQYLCSGPKPDVSDGCRHAGLSSGLSVLVGGMCETDFSGYPDCRDDAIKAMQLALNIGMDARMNLVTPLMWKNKKETWQLAAELGGQELVDLIVNETHTCYVGEHDKLNAWGFGCGECPACLLRKKGLKNSFLQKTSNNRLPNKKHPPVSRWMLFDF